MYSPYQFDCPINIPIRVVHSSFLITTRLNQEYMVAFLVITMLLYVVLSLIDFINNNT